MSSENIVPSSPTTKGHQHAAFWAPQQITFPPSSPSWLPQVVSKSDVFGWRSCGVVTNWAQMIPQNDTKCSFFVLSRTFVVSDNNFGPRPMPTLFETCHGRDFPAWKVRSTQTQAKTSPANRFCQLDHNQRYSFSNPTHGSQSSISKSLNQYKPTSSTNLELWSSLPPLPFAKVQESPNGPNLCWAPFTVVRYEFQRCGKAPQTWMAQATHFW